MTAIEILRAASRSVPNEDFVQFDDCIGAVAELIEAAKALSGSITFRIDDPRCDLHCKLVAALAAVGVQHG